jgi:hypothetical protein
MIVVQFAEELRKQLRARMNEHADFLAGGGASSFEHYKDMSGEIRGLAIAERMLLDAAERLERMDDGNE